MILNNKKGYVFSVTALIVGILLFAYLGSEFNSSNYEQTQEQINTRISQLDNEFLFVKESVLPQLVRYSSYYATEEFLDIISTDSLALSSMRGSHVNIQNSILELAINGTFDGTSRSAMDNKTINYLITSYEDFFNDFLLSNLTYSIEGARVYEKTPLQLAIEMEIDLNLEVQELDLEFSDTKFVDVSYSVEEFRDPNIALNINQSSAEILALERSGSTYGGEWTWDLFNETYENGYVTTFVYPEFKYTIGTSFLNSIANISHEGPYKNILSFLSFQYDKDSTPYDTKNFNTSHNLFTDTVFLATFDNVSSKIDETAYGRSLVTPLSCDNISGVNGKACNISTSVQISSLSLNSNSTMISFWVNYSSSGIIFNSSTLELEVDSSTRGLNISGKRNSMPDFSIDNINLTPNRWNNIIIHARENQGLEFLINSEIRYNQIIDGEFDTFEDISLSNAQFDEIVILNRSASNQEIAQLNQQRKALYLEYIDSLHTSGLSLYGGEKVDLNLSQKLNNSFNEFAAEFWFRAEEIDSPFNLLRLQNSSNSNYFQIELESTRINVSSNSFNNISSPVILDNNKYRHLLVQLKDSGYLEVYVNTQLVMNTTYTENIGNYDVATLLDENSQIVGLIDEFVLHNTSFSQREIEQHYFNFESSVGGCCNYFKMYNEDTHGFLVPDNNSISASLIPRWGEYNITLVSMTQKNLSLPSSANWYSQYVDACQILVYNLDNYVDTSNDIKVGEIGFNCRELIEEGVY